MTAIAGKTKTALIEAVERIVQDASYTEDVIEGFLNDGLYEVAGLVPLPDLKTSATVTASASANYVNLETDTHYGWRSLFHVFNTTVNCEVLVYPSLDLLKASDVYGWGESGSVLGCAFEGQVLYYMRRAANVLTVDYYKIPDKIAAAGPTCLPGHLQAPLLVSYAAYNIFTEIYEGEPHPSIDRYEKRFQESLGKLQRFLGPTARKPVTPVQSLNWV